jgi:hypothetical protein
MGGSEGVLSGPSEACSGSLGRKARSAVAAVRFLLTLDGDETCEHGCTEALHSSTHSMRRRRRDSWERFTRERALEMHRLPSTTQIYF